MQSLPQAEKPVVVPQRGRPANGDESIKPRLVWPPSPNDLRRPLPHMGRLARFVGRRLIGVVAPRIVSVRGLERLDPANDPFIVVSNHNQRHEAVVLPSLLIWHRGGKRIHYTSDWAARFNLRAIPFIWLGQVIPVFTKRARRPVFEYFKPAILRRHPGSVLDRCTALIRNGASVGFFPEGTVNRDPRRLLRGRYGAARLALATGVPIIPIGIRFPEVTEDRAIGDEDRMAIRVGTSIPVEAADNPSIEHVRSLHSTIMRELSSLSGKEWSPKAPLRRFRDAP